MESYNLEEDITNNSSLYKSSTNSRLDLNLELDLDKEPKLVPIISLL